MEEIIYLLSNPAMPEIFMILKTTNEDPIKHYRTEYTPNGNNKFNLNLTL